MFLNSKDRSICTLESKFSLNIIMLRREKKIARIKMYFQSLHVTCQQIDKFGGCQKLLKSVYTSENVNHKKKISFFLMQLNMRCVTLCVPHTTGAECCMMHQLVDRFIRQPWSLKSAAIGLGCSECLPQLILRFLLVELIADRFIEFFERAVSNSCTLWTD